VFNSILPFPEKEAKRMFCFAEGHFLPTGVGLPQKNKTKKKKKKRKKPGQVVNEHF
jgi:hypothetical protein